MARYPNIMKEADGSANAKPQWNKIASSAHLPKTQINSDYEDAKMPQQTNKASLCNPFSLIIKNVLAHDYN